MKKRIFAFLALIGGAVAAPAQSIDSGDPAAIVAVLTTMGYKPGAIDPNDGNPLFNITINNFDTVVVFGDCTQGKACRYMAFVSRFTDVKNAPADWLNARNTEMDLGKVWSGDGGIVSFGMSVPTGAAPMTPPVLRYMIEQWQGIVSTLSQSAVDAKLVK